MNRFFVILVLLGLPLAVAGQQGNSESTGTSSTANDSAAQAQSPKTTAASGQPQGDTQATADLTSDQDPNAPSQKKKPQTTPSSEPPPSRPKIAGSMVGYIDDAVIGTQVRIRFDAAFNDQFPDLAEFFYAKCGCYKAWAPSTALDPNAAGPGGGVPTRLNFQQYYVRAEYAPLRRFSFYVEVPFRWIQPQGFLALGSSFPAFPNEGGISDIQAGFKLAVVANRKQYLTVQMQGSFPSGNASKGLGTGHYSVQPELTYYQRLPGRAALEAEGGILLPIGNSTGVPNTGSTTNFASGSSFAGSVFFYGVGPSYKLYDGEKVQIAPVLEMVGWHILSGYVTDIANPIIPGGPTLSGIADPAAGINIVNLKAGVRISFGHSSIYAGFGHALTHVTWYQDILRIEYRYAF